MSHEDHPRLRVSRFVVITGGIPCYVFVMWLAPAAMNVNPRIEAWAFTVESLDNRWRSSKYGHMDSDTSQQVAQVLLVNILCHRKRWLLTKVGLFSGLLKVLVVINDYFLRNSPFTKLLASNHAA